MLKAVILFSKVKKVPHMCLGNEDFCSKSGKRQFSRHVKKKAETRFTFLAI